jgi:hypothetical protein
MDNVQNCDSYINIPSSQIYIYIYIYILYSCNSEIMKIVGCKLCVKIYTNVLVRHLDASFGAL